jgi:hypothetical protein
MKHIHTFESFLNEGKDIVTFSIDDERLDKLLHDNYGKKLDYTNIKGDEYYTLSRPEFDRFIDAAFSRGFDTDYEESPDAVIHLAESMVFEADSQRLKILQELADIIIAKNKGKWSKSSDDRIKAFEDAYNNEEKLIKLLTPKA